MQSRKVKLEFNSTDAIKNLYTIISQDYIQMSYGQSENTINKADITSHLDHINNYLQKDKLIKLDDYTMYQLSKPQLFFDRIINRIKSNNNISLKLELESRIFT